MLESYQTFLKVFKHFLNNQFCPHCQSPTTLATPSMALDFHSNLHSLRPRKQVSSPNLAFGRARGRSSDKRFRFITEKQRERPSFPDARRNVFERGMSRTEDPSSKGFFSGPHPREQSKARRQLRAGKARGEAQRGQRKETQSRAQERSENEGKAERGRDAGSLHRASERGAFGGGEPEPANAMANTRQLTMGKRSPSYVNLEADLESAETDSGREVRRRHTEFWKRGQPDFGSAEPRAPQSEGAERAHRRGGTASAGRA